MYWTLVILPGLPIYASLLGIVLKFFLYFCCGIWADSTLNLFTIPSAVKCWQTNQQIGLSSDSVAGLTNGSKVEMNHPNLTPPCMDALVDCLLHRKMAVRLTVKPAVAEHDFGQSWVHKSQTISSITAKAVIKMQVKFFKQMILESYANF